MLTSRIEDALSSSLKDLTFFRNSCELIPPLEALRCAIEAKVHPAEKIDYVLNVKIHKQDKSVIKSCSEEQYMRDQYLSKKAPELLEILRLKHPGKIVTALLQYQDTAKGKNNWYVNLLLAQNYLILEERNYEQAIACIYSLFDEQYLDFSNHNAKEITRLIKTIAFFNKEKAGELLRIQFLKEARQKNRKYIDVKHILFALKEMNLFDEEIEIELIELLVNELFELYKTINRWIDFQYEYNFDTITVALLYLAQHVTPKNRKRLMNVLLGQYSFDLIQGIGEIRLQLVFEVLVKHDCFNHFPPAKLDEILNGIALNEKYCSRDSSNHLKQLIARLEQLINAIKDAVSRHAVERTLAKCYLNLINIESDNASLIIEKIPLEQLKILFVLELETREPRFAVVLHIVRTFLNKKSFDEKHQYAWIEYCRRHITHYEKISQNYRKLLTQCAIDHIAMASDSNKLSLRSILCSQYKFELSLSKDVTEIAQNCFDELLKEIFCFNIHDFQALIKVVALHSTERRIDHLNKIKNHINEPAALQITEQALLKCNQALMDAKLKNYEHLIQSKSSYSDIPSDILKALILLELESKNPRLQVICKMTCYILPVTDEKLESALIKYAETHIFNGNLKSPLCFWQDMRQLIDALIVISINPRVTEAKRNILMGLLCKNYLLLTQSHSAFHVFVYRENNLFDQFFKLDCFNEMAFENFKILIDTIAKCDQREHLHRLERIKQVVSGERLNFINYALMTCYLSQSEQSKYEDFHNPYSESFVELGRHISFTEQAIRISNEIKFDEKYSPDILRTLAKRERCPKDLVFHLLDKCYKLGNLDAMLDIAERFEKEEEIDDVIKCNKIAVVDAIKTSNLPVLKRGMIQLFALLVKQGAGFKSAQLAVIKETIFLVYRFVYENSKITDESKFEFLNVLSIYLVKTRRFIDLSELFGLMRKDYLSNKTFLDLACDYFNGSTKQKEYLELRENLVTTRMKLSAVKALSEAKDFSMTNLLQEVIKRFPAFAKTNLLLNEVKDTLDYCVSSVISRGFIDSNSIKLLFSSEFEKSELIAEMLQNSIKKTLAAHNHFSLLFETYFHMFQSNKFKNKNEIAESIVEVISKIKDVGKYKYQFLQIAMDPSLAESVKVKLNKCSEKFYSTNNTNKMHAKEFARILHLPAIVFLINRKMNSKFGVRNNPGYDYLCMLLLILTKGRETPEFKEMINAAEIRIRKLPEHVSNKYMELIRKAPTNLVNVHMYFHRNVARDHLAHGVFLDGMQRALGFKDKIEWREWLKIIESINAPKTDVREEPSAPEESKAEKSDQPITPRVVAEIVKMPMPAPSAPPLEAEPVSLAANPGAMFYHGAGKLPAPSGGGAEKTKASLLAPA